MRLKIVILTFVISFQLSAQQNQDIWFTDVNTVQSYAMDNDLSILMVFSGSDWCRPCIKFKKDILENNRFREETGDKIAVLLLDFPSKKKNQLDPELLKHNEALAERYNSSGVFPRILLFNEDMSDFTELKYKGQTADEFIKLIN
ncbi:MAG: thioredoxin family protein [Bacteroidia bacterium]|nr:thioredoxin family protein [Bacteroidia bacterium]